MAAVWGRGVFFSLPLLFFLPCRLSPLGCISCTGAGIGGAAWVQFLQRLTSAQRLCKANPRGLTQQPRTRVPLPAGPLTAAVASLNILPSRVMQVLGSGGPWTKVPWYTKRCIRFVFATTPLRWVSPAPCLAFLVAFFSPPSGIQIQELICIAAVDSCPLPR